MATQAKIHLSVDGSSQVISEFDRVESKVGKLGDAVDRAKSQLAALGVGLGIVEIARISDEYAKYTAQLKLATNSELEYANAKSRVSSIAKASQSELASTAMLYARITNGTRELGITQQKVGDIVEAVTLSLKTSGATQEESASAILQLSQSFASGTLRGEEFNAVNDAAPRIMKALADGLGVPIGSLREMAKEGKLTSQILADTLPQALESLRVEAAKVQTIGGAYTVLKNKVLEMVGAQSQQNGTAALLSGTINILANNLNLVTAAATGFAATRFATKIADMVLSAKASVLASTELAAAKARESAATLQSAQANVAATATTVALTQARVMELRQSILSSQGAVALAITTNGLIPANMAASAASLAHTEALVAEKIAMGLANTGAMTLRGSLAFLGGPIGFITTLLGIGTAAWLAWGNKSKESTELATESVKDSTAAILKSLDAQISKHEKIIALREKGLGLDDAKKIAENKNRSQLEVEGKGLADLLAGKGVYQSKTLSGEDKLFERMRIMERIAELTKKINEEEAKGEKANGITRNEKLKDWFDKNGSAAQRMTAELDKLKKEFGEIPPEMEKVIRAKYADKNATKDLAEENKNAHDLVMGRLKAQKEMNQEVHKDLKKFESEQLERTKKLVKELGDSIIEQDKNYLSMSNSMDAYAQTMADNNELAQFEISLLGVSSVERAALIDQKKIELQLEKQIKEIRASNMAEGQKNILIEKANTQAKIDGSTAFLRAQQQEVSKSVEKYDDIFRQGFASMLNKGKGTWSAFTKSLSTTFKTQVADELYKTFARPFVVKMVASLLGITGTGAATAQGVGGLGSVSSTLSTGASLWEGFASAGTAAGVFGSTGFMASLAGGLNGAGIGSGLTSAAGLSIGGGIQSVIGTSAASSLSTGVSAISGVLGAIPVWGWAALGAAAIAASLGGGKDRVIGAQSVSGTLGTNDINRNVDWTKDGGWFNANTSGTWNYNLANSTAQASNGQFYQDSANVANDQSLLTQLNSSYDAIKAASANYATALGINADVIVNRVDKMSFALGKTQEEIDKAIQSMFAGIADDMARTLIPTISSMSKEGETASQTLGRIANGFVNVNSIFADLQLSLFKIGEEGYKASSVFIDLVGGVDALKAKSQSYYNNFFTQEERNASILKTLTSEFEKQSLILPTTREGYRALVESIREVGTPEQLAALFNLNDAFASVVAITDQVAVPVEKLSDEISKFSASTDNAATPVVKLGDAMSDMVEKANAALTERKNLQDQIDQATMTSVQLLEKQKSALDESNFAKFDELQVVLAEKAAKEQLASVNANIQSQIDQLINATLSVAQVREKELQGVDASTAALIKRKNALEDEAGASKAAKDAAQAQSTAIGGVMTTALNGLEATAKAFHDLAKTMQEARDGILFDSQSSLTGQQKLAYAQSQIDSAKVEDLPALTSNYLKVLNENAADLLTYQQGSMRVAARLDEAAYAYDAKGTAANSKEAYAGLAAFGQALAEQAAQAAAKAAIDAVNTSAAYALRDGTITSEQYLSRVGYQQSVDGSHAGGLDYVPFDGYVAQLHKGERVQTAKQAQSSDQLVAEIRQLREELQAQNVAIAKNTADTARTLKGWNVDGQPEVRVVIPA